MKGTTVLLSTLLLLVLGGCKDTEKTTATTEAEALVESTMTSEKSEFATLERTACFGQCPIYKITLYSNGYVTYYGKNFVDRMGMYEGKVGKAFLDKITALANKANYMSLENQYDSGVSDFARVITSFTSNGKTKTITRRHIGPQELIDYEKQFDKLFEGVNWTLVEEPKE